MKPLTAFWLGVGATYAVSVLFLLALVGWGRWRRWRMIHRVADRIEAERRERCGTVGYYVPMGSRIPAARRSPVRHYDRLPWEWTDWPLEAE